MKTWMVMLVVVAGLVLCGCSGPDQPKWAGGAMVGDNTAEVRLGGQLGALEGYVAPQLSADLASSGDIGTGLRGYAIYNAITVDMIGAWFGNDIELPEGAAYGGIYGGRDFGRDIAGTEWQAGWLVGARVDIGSTDDYQLDLATEYQRPMDGDGDEVVMVGPRLLFK